jgi:hypothetical protein
MEYTYKIVLLSENRATYKRYVDKVLNITIEQREFNRTNAVNKIHENLRNTYDTKSRRYRGFLWVVDCLELL